MVNRIIQFKRNRNIARNAVEAKSNISNLTLENGEIVIGTYTTATNPDGSAKVIGVKANNKVFNLDNQSILDAIGIDDNGNVNPLATGSTILKSIDYLNNKIDAISGGTSSDIVGLSAKTVTNVVDTNTIDLTISDNTADYTKQISADVKLSLESGNVILAKNDGIYSKVDYDATRNVLIVNGDEKPLNAGSIVDSIQYDAETESLVINYRDTSGGTHSVSAPLSGIIEEYEFEAADTNHNVEFTVTRSVSGSTSVQADISNYDCGEY